MNKPDDWAQRSTFSKIRSHLLAHAPATVLGLLAVLSFAPFKLFPLLFFCLAALFVRWERASTPSRAAIDGFAFGLGFFGFGVGWLYSTLHTQAHAPEIVAFICTVLLVAYLSLFPMLVAWAQARLGGSAVWRFVLLMPALWMLAELLSGWLFSGFPWLSLGVSQAPFSPLVGFAPLIGGHGLTGLVLLCSGFIALAWKQKRLWPLVVPVVFMASGWGLTLVEWTRPIGKPISVGLVQGNVDQESKWDIEKLVGTLDDHTELAERSRATLTILPETAFPIFLDDVPEKYLDRLKNRALKNKGDVLLGVPLHTKDGKQYLNSVISMGTSPAQIYSKSHLVPFGEYIPLKWLFGGLYEFIDMPMVDFRAGGFDQKPLKVGGQSVAFNICYEDVFGTELRHPIPAATLMANISNDAWFGTSHAPWQHLQMVQMRAIESGRWWLRSTNTGVTAIVDERGRLVKKLPQFVPGILEGTAQGRTGTTPYVLYGDTPLWIAGCIALIIGLLRKLRQA